MNIFLVGFIAGVLVGAGGCLIAAWWRFRARERVVLFEDVESWRPNQEKRIMAMVGAVYATRRGRIRVTRVELGFRNYYGTHREAFLVYGVRDRGPSDVARLESELARLDAQLHDAR